jgi:hypothetical protein
MQGLKDGSGGVPGEHLDVSRCEHTGVFLPPDAFGLGSSSTGRRRLWLIGRGRRKSDSSCVARNADWYALSVTRNRFRSRQFLSRFWTEGPRISGGSLTLTDRPNDLFRAAGYLRMTRLIGLGEDVALSCP